MTNDPWQTLSNAISDTLSGKESDHQLTMIDQACNDLVSEGKFDQIHDGLHNLLKNHFKEWHNQLVNVSSGVLLTKLNEQYDFFKKSCAIIPTFFTSYEQHFQSEPNKVLNSIRKEYIAEILSDDKLFKEQATTSILEVISNAQKGSNVDFTKISNIIDMYYSFNSENDKPDLFSDFYDKLNQQEAEFCDTFYINNFNPSDFTKYLKDAERQISKLTQIFNEHKILKETDSHSILKNFNLKLFKLKENDFLNGDHPLIIDALTSECFFPIKNLIQAYIQYNFDLDPIYLSISQYVKKEILKKDEKYNKYIYNAEAVIDFISKIKNPYDKLFTDNQKALTELDDRIKEALNTEDFEFCLEFNKYIDKLITTRFNEYDINKQLQIILQFYQYIEDKDKFTNIYTKLFVHRLIRNKSIVEEYECPVIDIIRKVSPDFMINSFDSFNNVLIESSKLKDEFKQRLDKNDKKIDFVVDPIVFDHHDFPLSQDIGNVSIDQIEQFNYEFQNFYFSKYKKRINIMPCCSLIELKIDLTRPNRSIYVTTDLLCGSVIFTLSKGPMKFKNIVLLLNIDRSIAIKVIKSLFDKRIIIPKERVCKIEDDSQFIINPGLNAQKRLFIQPVTKFSQ